MANTEASIVISAVDQATETINKVTGQFNSLGSHWGKLTAALGIGAGFTALTTLVKNSIEAGDRMGELSQITGVSVKTLSELQLAARNSGVDIEQVASILGKMNKNLSGVEEPGTKAAEGLGMLGINAEKFKAAKVEDRIFMLADAAKGADNSTGDLSRAMDLVVKGGSALIPMLSGGSEKLREQMELAKKLGMSLTDDVASGMDNVADTMGMMKMQSEGFGTMLATKLLPTLEGLSKMWLDNASEAGSFTEVIGSGLVIAFKTVISVASAAWDVMKAFGIVAAGTAAALATGKWSVFTEAVSDANKVMADGKKRLEDLWKDALPKYTEGEKTAAKAIKDRDAEARKLAAATLAQEKADKDAAAEAKRFAAEANRLAEEQRKLRASILDQITAMEIGTATTEKMSEAQKLMLKIGEQLRDGKLKLTEAEKQEVFQRLVGIDTLEKDRIAREAATKTIEKEAAAYVKAHDAAADLVAKYEDELSAMQVTGTEREIQIKLLELEKTGVEKTSAAYSEYEQRIREAVGSIQAQKASKEASENSAKEWSKAAEQIEQALTDALVQGFEGGKSIVKSIGDYIVNFFKTTVAKGIAQALTGAIMSGMSGVARAGGGGLSNVLGGGGGSSGGGGFDFGSIGSSIISGIAGSSAFGGGMMAGLFNGVGMSGTLSAAGSLFGTGTMSGAAAGGGMMIGAAIPYVAAAYALYRIISGVGTGRARGPGYQEFSALTGSGAQIPGFYDPRVISNPGGGTAAGGHWDQQLTGIINAVDAAARSVGGRGGADTQYSIYTSTSPDGQGTHMVGSAGSFYSATNIGTADIQQHLQMLLPHMILAGLQSSDLPIRMQEYFNSISAHAITQEQLDAMIATAAAVNAMAEAVGPLGGVFRDLGSLSVVAASELLTLTGGLDAFISKVKGFVSSYYSEGEQAALTAQAISTALTAAGVNISGLDTRAEYRALLEGVNVSTKAGQAQFAALLNSAEAFAGISDYLEKQGLTLDELAQNAPQVAAIETLAEQQANETAEIVTSLGSVVDAIEGLGKMISDAVTKAITDVGTRPVNVTIASAEVNGGVA